ncbi:NTP transferase domain-containing protein, partial [Tessaracoccus lubricantis]
MLGGGRSARMGTDKLALRLGGATLLDRTCA